LNPTLSATIKSTLRRYGAFSGQWQAILVIREGCLLMGLGVTLGLAGVIGVTRVLRGLLYGVTPLDGLTIASVVALVAAMALVAVGAPAWRSARVDPAVALKAE
jgi:putative ABC transport system permease protein